MMTFRNVLVAVKNETRRLMLPEGVQKTHQYMRLSIIEIKR